MLCGTQHGALPMGHCTGGADGDQRRLQSLTRTLPPCAATGMMWSECKELWLEGPREYIMQLWNLLDFGMLSIFIAAFTARFLAFLQAAKAQQYVDSNVQESDLSEVTLPPEIQYFTYGKSVAAGSPCRRGCGDRFGRKRQ